MITTKASTIDDLHGRRLSRRAPDADASAFADRRFTSRSAVAAVGWRPRGWVGGSSTAPRKERASALLDTRESQPPLPQAALARTADAAAQQHFRLARAAGRWLADRTVFLDNRQHGRRPARLSRRHAAEACRWQRSAGAARLGAARHAATGRSCRAWPRRTAKSRSPAALPRRRLACIEFDTGASGPIRQNLDPEAFAREIGVSLRPLSVLQTVRWSRRIAPRLAASDAVDVHKHYGYAFQWFALCRADRRSVCLVPTPPAPGSAASLRPLAFTVHSLPAPELGGRRGARGGPAADAAGAGGLRGAGGGVVLHLFRDPAAKAQANTRADRSRRGRCRRACR